MQIVSASAMKPRPPATSCNLATGRFNFVGNYWRPGPNTKPYAKELPIQPKSEAHNVTTGFLSDNFFENKPEWTADNYGAFQWGVRGGKYIGEVTPEKINQPAEVVPPAARPATQSAAEAYALVIAKAGASNTLDAADERVIAGIKARKHRRIDSQKEVGGWPELTSGTAPKDTDRDGMPDEWEKQNGLNPDDTKDGNVMKAEGYTALEMYLNSRFSRK